MKSYLEDIYQEPVYRVPAAVVVILPKAWADVTETERSLLSKILSSVKLSIDSVVIGHDGSPEPESLKNAGIGTALLFGVRPDITPYQKHSFGQLTLLTADALTDLDDTRKKSLWTALKQVFNV